MSVLFRPLRRTDIRPATTATVRLRKLTATVAVALAAAALAAPRVSAAPPDPSTPGSSAARRAPAAGELVTAVPLDLKSYPNTKAWRITYRSTTTTGKPDVVSGAVIVPVTAVAGTPVVGYAPGTLGLGDQCAQSRNLDVSLLQARPPSEREFIQNYTNAGYAVAVTDYQGLGTPGGYPYQVGRSEGHALLDVVRAARRLPGTNLSPDAPAALAGYSQGGLATGWAAQLAPSYAPELDLLGISVGAPPADSYRNIRYLQGQHYAGLSLMAVYGFDVAYPQLHLERYLNAKGRAAFADIADDCIADIDDKWQGRRLSEYTTEDFLKRPEWRAALARESLGRQTPTVPVLLFASKDDTIVPYGPTAKLAKTWQRHGADVTFVSPKTGDHGETGYAMAPVASGWIAAHVLGLLPARAGR